MTFKKALPLILAGVALLLTVGSGLANPDKYPHRSEFSAIKTVETEELRAGLESGDFIAVDARSQLEFDVIHIDGAQHIQLSKKTFKALVLGLVAANPGKKIAFYCNGTTCLKSYKAAQKAMIAGVENAYAYDAGIPEWARVYPEATQLLGATIKDPESQLISKANFKDHVLDWAGFQDLQGKDAIMTIDVRDVIQRSEKLPGLQNVKLVPLDIFIPNFVSKEVEQDKTLLIFDQVGKQVKWLQYYLEKYGYDKYYFLDGGATSVLKSQQYRS